MGLNHGWRGPNIVKDGLVLYLDAGSPNSYQGTGTIWKDISKVNQNNGTLNGVSFNPLNGGSFIWDNEQDSITLNAIQSLSYTSSTVCFWLKNLDTRFVFLSRGSGGPYLGAVWVGGNGSGNWYHSGVGSPIAYRNGILSNSPLNNNTWNYYTFTNCNFSESGWRTQLTILRYTSGWEFSDGELAMIKIYNRNLPVSEVLQNYNATKGRFGL
jgi:hypothetical protein